MKVGLVFFKKNNNKSTKHAASVEADWARGRLQGWPGFARSAARVAAGSVARARRGAQAGRAPGTRLLLLFSCRPSRNGGEGAGARAKASHCHSAATGGDRADSRRARPLPYVCIKKRSPTPAHFCFLSQQWPLRFEQVGVDVRVSTSLASCKARRRETLRTQAPRARLSPPGAPEPRGPEVLRAAGEGRCGPRPRPRLCGGGPGAATGRGRAAGTRPWRDLPCPRRLNRGRRRIIPGHFSETSEHDLFLTVSYYPGLGRDF